jgi:glycerophosphoryl diester phosphodiesterase
LHNYNTKKHNYSKNPFGFYLGAHRGGSLEGLENTLSNISLINLIANIKRAKEIGASYVEMDVCLSKDNRVVVVHDDNLKRICGVDKFVKDFNFDDLPPIQDKISLHFSEEIFEASKVKDKKLACFDKVCQALGKMTIECCRRYSH